MLGCRHVGIFLYKCLVAVIRRHLQAAMSVCLMVAKEPALALRITAVSALVHEDTRHASDPRHPKPFE